MEEISTQSLVGCFLKGHLRTIYFYLREFGSNLSFSIVKVTHSPVGGTGSQGRTPLNYEFPSFYHHKKEDRGFTHLAQKLINKGEFQIWNSNVLPSRV